MKLDKLVFDIIKLDDAIKSYATKAVNRSLTIRNWVIGAYIVEYEQKGEERAQYGTKLLSSLEEKINRKGFTERNFLYYRDLYIKYPHIIKSQAIADLLLSSSNLQISNTLYSESENNENQSVTIPNTLYSELPQENTVHVNPDEILNNLSFSHLRELTRFDDAYKRAFYELETIKGGWSVRQLKRQINALYYERSAMSKDPAKLMSLTQDQGTKVSTSDLLKDVFVMEFLDLPVRGIVRESDLEKALLDNIEHFLLELGHGFCFEARQKNILIGDEYFFIDLVFYNRVLKCHVLVELKVEEFSHNNAGQLNTYLNYYKDKVQLPDDNPPIGILLVTDKNKTLVEYATGGLDHNLFVRKYMLELPEVQLLKLIIEKEIGI